MSVCNLLRQDRAIHGLISQRSEAQAIGSVSEKAVQTALTLYNE